MLSKIGLGYWQSTCSWEGEGVTAPAINLVKVNYYILDIAFNQLPERVSEEIFQTLMSCTLNSVTYCVFDELSPCTKSNAPGPSLRDLNMINRLHVGKLTMFRLRMNSLFGSIRYADQEIYWTCKPIAAGHVLTAVPFVSVNWCQDLAWSL